MTKAVSWSIGRILFLVALVAGCASTPGPGAEDAVEAEGDPLSGEIKALEEALAGEPTNPEAHYRLGNALFDGRRIQEAMVLYRQTIALDPRHASAQCNLGLCYRLLGNMPAALEAYEAALAISPDDVTILQNTIIAFQTAGDLDGALRHLRHLSNIERNDVKIRSALGETLLELGLYDEAAEAYRGVLELDPGYAGDYYNLGLCYFYLENWDSALTAWLTALAYDREHPSLLKGLAVVYWRKGDYERAWNAVSECQRLGVPLDPDFIVQLQKDSGQVGPE